MTTAIRPSANARAPGPPYTSGHCAVGYHPNCRGTYAGVDCSCPYHRTCLTCGQSLPEVDRG